MTTLVNHKMIDVVAAKERCLKYRKRILDISQNVGALHIAPAFSCLEITDVVYNTLMRKNDDGLFHDTFVMSKGHGCMSQYVILNDHGILSDEDLQAYCTPKGRLGAHPDIENPGIEASTGSLGHGMGLSVGMAYADKLLKADRTVYLIKSDGELQEGSTWEGMMMAANLGLKKLICFIDQNDFTGLERLSEGHPAFYPLEEKAQSFGWEVASVNGHNAEEIYHAVNQRQGEKPLFVVCKTVKGKGVSYMENVPIWHYRSPSAEEYMQALNELEEISS